MSPANIGKTIRQQMISLLTHEARSAQELSQLLRIPEKEVYHHLPHLARSLSSQNRELVIIPCGCLECGYLFRGRKRYTTPSRCPRCRSERIEEARFQVV